ncbi:hypothetical protein SAMN02910456_02450 [Ruminococcaceae bacterium YRB3002]|nr:hypothetical protein SAMN02910456_02450 [Ruminococcaceae bacterium YRB3002]
MRKRAISIGLIVIDIIFLVLFVFVIPDFLRDTVGYDVIEYENWSGELAESTFFNFGAGCWELTIILVRLAGFIIGQCVLLKDLSRKQMVIGIMSHVLTGVLGLIYFFSFADGPNLVYLIEQICDRMS